MKNFAGSHKEIDLQSAVVWRQSRTQGIGYLKADDDSCLHRRFRQQPAAEKKLAEVPWSVQTCFVAKCTGRAVNFQDYLLVRRSSKEMERVFRKGEDL